MGNLWPAVHMISPTRSPHKIFLFGPLQEKVAHVWLTVITKVDVSGFAFITISIINDRYSSHDTLPKSNARLLQMVTPFHRPQIFTELPTVLRSIRSKYCEKSIYRSLLLTILMIITTGNPLTPSFLITKYDRFYLPYTRKKDIGIVFDLLKYEYFLTLIFCFHFHIIYSRDPRQ